MKRILNIVLILGLILLSITIAFAEGGDGNIDGGGGSMSGGSKSNFWNPSDDGIRVTVVDSKTGNIITLPVDFSNKVHNSVEYHFGKVSKLQYKNGQALLPSFIKYKSYQLDNIHKLPVIITSKTLPANISITRKTLSSEGWLKAVAPYLNISYDDLSSGKYKLVVEPVSYFTFQGDRFAMTATEAALYDKMLNGKLKAWLGSMSHKNLAFALFLQNPDLGIVAWKGTTNSIQSNTSIIDKLGIGIVSFNGPPPVIDDEVVTIKYMYRTDTDVITSVRVAASTDITPDGLATINFQTSNGYSASKDVTIPGGESQLVWIRWHTPKSPGTVRIDVTISGNLSAQIIGPEGTVSGATIYATVEDIHSNLPPHPTANDKKPTGFIALNATLRPQRSSASWTIWRCYWHENWVQHSSTSTNADGSTTTHTWWVDEGWWEYASDTYSAAVDSTFVVEPDDKVPTKSGDWMRSGYGVKEHFTINLHTNAPLDQVTGAQNALTYYPEFGFKKYRRPMEITSGSLNANFDLPVNKYSTYGRRVHFSPVWYPDGMYDVYAEGFDIWTPDGMLTQTKDDYVLLRGSVWDDWHIGIVSDLIR